MPQKMNDNKTYFLKYHITQLNEMLKPRTYYKIELMKFV